MERKNTLQKADYEAIWRDKQIEPQKRKAERLVTSTLFDAFITTIVLVNTILLGANIHHDCVTGGKIPLTYDILEYVCTGIFAVELVLRIYGQRWQLCNKSNRYWCILDVTLVSFSAGEITILIAANGAIDLEKAGLAKLLKIARMCRVFRAFRMFRFLQQIRIMVLQIASSFSALAWFMLLLSGILYFFAIVITSGVAGWVRPSEGDLPNEDQYLLPGDVPIEDVMYFFGGIDNTMYTLFMCITGGVSWGEPGRAITVVGELYFFVFFIFIFGATFSVLNVITGVFVDSAIQQAETDRVVRMQKAQRVKKDMEKALRELFHSLDIDGDDFITENEWAFACERPDVKHVLQTLEINGIDSEDIFDLLDIDHDGVLKSEEFMDGLTMIRGMAKSVDLYKVSVDLRNVHADVRALLRVMTPNARSATMQHD